MAKHVVNGATLQCSCSMPTGIVLPPPPPDAPPPDPDAPPELPSPLPPMGTGPLTVLPVHRMLSSNQPAANIMDHVPLVNIPSFGMCISPSSPSVISATSAALGVFTPFACIPKTPAPWTPGSPTVLLDGMPVLNDTSTCMCIDGGTISVVAPGQATEIVP
ncbi:MAG: DUF4280 domain-containing protein [Pseudomonadales bacterium]|jgi:hypothetical protein|nr:DUF4280 domain-containing protein [Pseudomonadales bacterium]